MRTLKDRYKDDRNKFIVIREKSSKKIVGFAEMSLRQLCRPRQRAIAKINSLAIDKDYRRLKLGSTMVDSVFHELKLINQTEVFVEVENERLNDTISFYNSLGFVELVEKNPRKTESKLHTYIQTEAGTGQTSIFHKSFG